MGFAGGGSGALPAHQHNNVPLSGGPLDFSNVTVGSLAAGSVVYSDGAALQELVKPAVPAGEVLSYPALATSPSWVAGGGLSTMTRSLIAYSTAQSTSSTSMVSLTGLQHTCQAGAGHAILLFNGILETDESYAFNWAFSVDANPVEVAGKASPVGVKECNYTAVTETLSSQTVDLQFRVKNPAGTATMQVDNTNSNFYVLEIS